ncbi:hypothetical protein XA68_17679 [Ophiocordyceps unilateralis]|uniref:Uncharacterized protein n=1 Tax=Ophiocordyceps unilateralis TaxID=268505 RepID=A0A2A9PJC2_OPHUN|nr:hypothetical protein XA68_17679 [Ophiocordyceps unilateralis]
MDGQQPSSLPRAAKSPHFLHRHYHDNSRRRDATHDNSHHHSSRHGTPHLTATCSDDATESLDELASDCDSSHARLQLRTVTEPSGSEQAPVADAAAYSNVAITGVSSQAATVSSASDTVASSASDTVVSSALDTVASSGLDTATSNVNTAPSASTNTVTAATSSYTSASFAAPTSLLADIKTTSWLTTAPASTPSPITSTHAIFSDLRNGTNAMPNANSSLATSPLTVSSSPSNSSLPSSLNSSSPTTSSFDVSILSAPTSFTRTSTESQVTSLVREVVTKTDLESESTESADAQSTSFVTEFFDDSSSSLPATASTSSGGGAVAPETTGSIPPNKGSGTRSNAAAPPEALPPKARVIVGVVTSVAGVAFIMLLALLALKYNKKRRDGRQLLGGGHLGSMTPRGITGSDSMTTVEVPGLPTTPAPPTGFGGSRGDAPAERGFYRVAGRKLPPVLMTGGDGFSDPRDTMLSDNSSEALDPAAGGSRPLALGAPMRPVSGIPIMRSGPARTPVTQNPFADPPSSPLAQGGPPGSRDRSRFHEGI